MDVGKVNAFTLYTEIDGIDRFPSAKQFFSYCRLVPGLRDLSVDKLLSITSLQDKK